MHACLTGWRVLFLKVEAANYTYKLGIHLPGIPKIERQYHFFVRTDYYGFLQKGSCKFQIHKPSVGCCLYACFTALAVPPSKSLNWDQVILLYAWYDWVNYTFCPCGEQVGLSTLRGGCSVSLYLCRSQYFGFVSLHSESTSRFVTSAETQGQEVLTLLHLQGRPFKDHGEVRRHL